MSREDLLNALEHAGKKSGDEVASAAGECADVITLKSEQADGASSADGENKVESTESEATDSENRTRFQRGIFHCF